MDAVGETTEVLMLVRVTRPHRGEKKGSCLRAWLADSLACGIQQPGNKEVESGDG